MIKKWLYLKTFLVILFVFSFSLPVYSAGLQGAFGTDNNSNEDNLDKVASTAKYDTTGAATQLETKIADVISAALSFLGVIFVLLMIYGGYLWMTDRGNEDQLKKAKDLITAAIIGLIIVLSAYAISYFVISYFAESALQ